MKKVVLTLTVVCMATVAFAQKANQEMKYRRSSLYTIMVPSDKLTGDAKTIVTNTFDTLAIPDKYNNHNLSVRHIDLTKIDVTEDEIKAAEQLAGGQKKGLAGLAKKGLGFAKKTVSTSETAGMSGDEKIAKIIKFFEQNHIANKIIGKWFNESKTLNKEGSHFNIELIKERGLFGASHEDINMTKNTVKGTRAIIDAAEIDLIPRTFVMVTSYAYMSAEEIAAMSATAGAMVGGTIGGVTQLASAAAGALLKGYFVTTTSYLFQLEWNDDIRSGFYDKYWKAKDTKAFDTDASYKLTYVGKTSCHAPDTMKLTTKDEASAKLISRATARATDKSIAQLQKKYDQFKTLTTLNISDDGETMYAYVGKKEGVKSGDKFEALEQILGEDGNITYKKVGTVKVAKGKVWDNRYGAGEKLEGGATDDDDDDKDSESNLQYTIFDGKPSKALAEGGLWLRQLK
ncbi:MAG: hypothetical protein IJ804_08420 [Prevotella sp.]|nr:hypothetical protein [Prevotella sp.]